MVQMIVFSGYWLVIRFTSFKARGLNNEIQLFLANAELLNPAWLVFKTNVPYPKDGPVHQDVTSRHF